MLRDELLNRLESDRYWEASDRGLFIVTYKGKQLNMKSNTYLTISSAKASLYVNYFQYTYSREESYTTSERKSMIKKFINELIDNGDIKFVNLLEK